MPLNVGTTYETPEYVLSYKKKEEQITVSAPNKDDAKELFTWLKEEIWP